MNCRGENEQWKVSIGYQNHGISLGDNYKEVNDKIGDWKLDVNSDNNKDLKNYHIIPDQMEIGTLKLNPIIFLRFNKNKLVRFEIDYTIDETVRQIDYQSILDKLAKEELTEIDDLVKLNRKRIFSNNELWLRKIDIDSVSGAHPNIKYRVQALP